jgi:Lipoprotein LpqB beta-propeller domain
MTDRRPAAAPGPRRGVAALTAGLALVVVLASGCAALPTSGTPEHAKTPPPPGGGVSQCCGLFVEPPQRGWSPSAVVSNFLLASSKSADNYQAARQYLTKQASASWHPGSQVVILSGTPSVIPLGRVNGPGGSTQVQANGPELATLNSSGQYIQAASGAKAPREVFTLQIQNGVYKIATLPPGHESALLLTSALFHLVYAPRDLYYYGQRNENLLPDPVYVPIQGANLADALVRDLRRNPAGTLDGAARTYVPPQTHVAGVQVFPGPSGGRTAIVNIALPHGTRANIPKMVAQLVCTVTSPAFSPALFRAVRVKINGRPWPPRGRLLNRATYQRLIPDWGRSDTGVYYLTPDGSIRTLLPAAHHGNVLAKGASGGEPSLSQVAVSPNGAHLAGLGGPATTVYTGGLGSSAKPGELRSQVTGSFSTLSWDSANDLWVVGRTKQLQGVGDWPGIFVLPGGQGSELLPVGHPRLPGPVTGLRVAPDGVRVALIIGSGASAQVWLAAILRGVAGGFRITRPVPLGGQGVTGVLTGVKAITWYDEDHLLAVAGSGSSTQLWEVPVDGDTPSALGGREPGVTSVTAAGPLNPIYLGLATRRLVRAAGLNQLLQQITAGQAPAYPG